MDNHYKNFISKQDVINPHIGKSLSSYLYEGHLEYLDKLLKSLSSTFIPGMKYIGISYLTFEETFKELTKPIFDSSDTYNISKNDMYPIKIELSYNDEPINKILFVPFMDERGELTLGDNHYVLSPTLMDKIISSTQSVIFVRFTKNKVKLNLQYHNIIVNGVIEPASVFNTTIYTKKNQNLTSSKKLMETLLLYLMVKFGFSISLKKLNIKPVIIGSVLEDGVDSVNYDPSKYTIIKSTMIEYTGKTKKVPNHINDLAIVFKNEDINQSTIDIIGNFFLLLDSHPTLLTNDILNGIPAYDHPDVMNTIFGITILGENAANTLICEEVEAHLKKVDVYVDNMVKEALEIEFKDSKYDFNKCNHFDDLLLKLITYGSSLISDSKGRSNDLRDRHYDVLYNTFYTFSTLLNIFNNNISNIYNNQGTILLSNIVRNLNNLPKQIMLSVKKEQHCVLITCPGGIPFISHGKSIALQPNISGAPTKKKKKAGNNPGDNRVSALMGYIGNINGISKSSGHPAATINPTANINKKSGRIVFTKEDNERLDKIQKELLGF